MECNRPHIGIGIIIENYDGKILLMRRKGAHSEGEWGLPGGKLEKFEEIIDCAIREGKEETGLDLIDLKINKFTNDMFTDSDLHYITIFVTSKAKSYDAKIMEPDKCTEIGWFYWNNLPEPLFLPIKNYIKYGLHFKEW